MTALATFLTWLSHAQCIVWWSFPDPASHTGHVFYGGSCVQAWSISWTTLLPWQFVGLA